MGQCAAIELVRVEARDNLKSTPTLVNVVHKVEVDDDEDDEGNEEKSEDDEAQDSMRSIE